jgi:hypothetical protein
LQDGSIVDKWSAVIVVIVELHNDTASNHLGWPWFFWLIDATRFGFIFCGCVAYRPLWVCPLLLLRLRR